jgi:hypothetical protein
VQISPRWFDDPRMPLFSDKNLQKVYEFEVVYKLKGNKHHRINVFAIDEMSAYTKATEAIKKHKT